MSISGNAAPDTTRENACDLFTARTRVIQSHRKPAPRRQLLSRLLVATGVVAVLTSGGVQVQRVIHEPAANAASTALSTSHMLDALVDSQGGEQASRDDSTVRTDVFFLEVPRWTTPGSRITHCFTRNHRALDVRTRDGFAVSVTDGRIAYVGRAYRGMRVSVVMLHSDGTAMLYGGLTHANVRVGQYVDANQRLGTTRQVRITLAITHQLDRIIMLAVDPLPWLRWHNVGIPGCLE